MKNFTDSAWNESLQKRNWSQIHDTNDLDEKNEIFTNLINKSLDEVAPFSTITIRSNYKFGLSEKTKEIMKKRDAARTMIKQSTGNQKKKWNETYKKLRNKATTNIRKDTIDSNNN